MAVSLNKLVASTSGDGTINVWDIVTGGVKQTLDVKATVTTLSFDDREMMTQ